MASTDWPSNNPAEPVIGVSFDGTGYSSDDAV
jgi:hypothetical protein